MAAELAKGTVDAQVQFLANRSDVPVERTISADMR
jgi:hypothetical protein